MTDRIFDNTTNIPALLEAAMFAAEKHRECRRKDANETPYINHPIKVANLLASVGKVDDIEMLQAGLLHDTVEDTTTKPKEIEEKFGRSVRDLVMEVTDNKKLKKAKRKRRQVEKAPHLTPRAKVIKMADKIANLTDIINSPPVGWPMARLRDYVHWSAAVVDGCRGQNADLEALYDVTSAKIGFTPRLAS